MLAAGRSRGFVYLASVAGVTGPEMNCRPAWASSPPESGAPPGAAVRRVRHLQRQAGRSSSRDSRRCDRREPDCESDGGRFDSQPSELHQRAEVGCRSVAGNGGSTEPLCRACRCGPSRHAASGMAPLPGPDAGGQQKENAGWERYKVEALVAEAAVDQTRMIRISTTCATIMAKPVVAPPRRQMSSPSL